MGHKIALIGSAEIPPGIDVLSRADAAQALRIDALTQDGRATAAPGLRLIHGSFLDAGKIETAVRGADTVVYAPRSRWALIPAYFERGLRYTLLAAGWSGAQALVVVPPSAPFKAWLRMQEWWCRRIADRALHVLQALPRGQLVWRLASMGEVVHFVHGGAPEPGRAARSPAGRRLCAVPPPNIAPTQSAANVGGIRTCRPRNVA